MNYSTKIKIKILVLFLLLILVSCNKTKNAVIGEWAIDSITYKGDDIRAYLFLNVFDFKQDGSCKTPEVDLYINGKGEWEIIKTDSAYYLKIETDNNLFNDKYLLYFATNEQLKLLRMILISDDMYIECSKFFYNIDMHRSDIRKLPIKPDN